MHSHKRKYVSNEKKKSNNTFIGKVTPGFTSSIDYRKSNETFRMRSLFHLKIFINKEKRITYEKISIQIYW